MDILFASLLETGWGVIVFGIMIIIALIIAYFDNRPQI